MATVTVKKPEVASTFVLELTEEEALGIIRILGATNEDPPGRETYEVYSELIDALEDAGYEANDLYAESDGLDFIEAA